jgi:hypothetical protein
MHRFAQIRFAAVVGLVFSASVPAQSPHPPQAKPSTSTPAASALPATPATTPEPPPVPLTPSQRPPQRAQVTYADGALSVSANNASLNQILRQIASDTGIKITGGVAEDRVFGQYGPADPAEVLAVEVKQFARHSKDTRPACYWSDGRSSDTKGWHHRAAVGRSVFLSGTGAEARKRRGLRMSDDLRLG